jgi:hypothetical protein
MHPDRLVGVAAARSCRFVPRILVAAIASVLILTPAASASNPPKKSIKVNFNSTAQFTESCGTVGTATASGLTAQQKTDMIAKMQADFDRALGAGKVNVTAGTGGDVEVVVNGGRAPGALQGTEWGDAGRPGAPAVVHEGEFTAAGAAGNNLVNAMSETASHEAGHRLGLGHNHDAPPSIMTDGSEVSLDKRQMGQRQFNADDTRKMQNLPKAQPAGGQKDSTLPTDLRTFVGELLNPPFNTPDDNHLNAHVQLQFLSPQTSIGYISDAGNFIFQADQLNFVQPTYISFLYNAGTDLAVKFGTQVHALSDGSGQYTLSNPNPNNPAVYLTAFVTFSAGSNSAAFALNVDMPEPHTGGFVPAGPGAGTVPTMSEWGLIVLAVSIVGAGAVLLRSRLLPLPVVP